MISFLTKKYIQKRAKESGLKYEKSSISILKDVEKRKITNGIHIRFSCLYNQSKFLNSNAAFYKCILLNPEYAFYLIYYNDKNLENAFNITIGHELTHKEKELHVYRLFSSKKMRFMAWVNEVHADFGGAQKRAKSERQKLLDSIRYKKNIHPNVDTDLHPSWDRRESYVKNFDFGSKLIDQIAKDTGYNNQKFINKVKTCGFYNDIKLH